MASSINASVSGAGGLISTADNSGILNIQTAGTNAITVSASQNTTFAGTVTLPTGTLYPLVSGTAVASTSGTSIDFTSIPSWVKRITIIMNGMSTNGTSNQLFQIGSGSVTTSGYQCITGSTGYTAGFGIPEASATRVTFGGIVLTNISGNIWVAFGSVGTTTGATQVMVGGVTLGGVLDRVRATTVNGTDAFDAGSINIMYE
jgi:hypothetical protein